MNSPVMLSALLVILAVSSGCQDKSTTKTDTPCMVHTTPFLYTQCAFHPTPDKFALYWQDNATQKPFYTFDALTRHHDKIVFAMNAGMYDDNFAPIGYTVIDGKSVKGLNLKDGQGNFHLMPNGVFWWHDDGFFVDESHAFYDKLNNGIRPRHATQSGPMLIINGQIHPKFNPNSTSYKIRNGVGVGCTDGRLHFIISDEPVNFYGFAKLFFELGCQNALFLDGGIASALYAKNLNRHDKSDMAVMITALP